MSVIDDVLRGDRKWACIQSDAIEFLRSLPDDSIDLLVTSPPYEDARTYGIGFRLAGQAWVDWMVEVVKAAAPKVKGLIAVNCEGRTENYRYSMAPFLLAADLHRAGFNMRKPVVFHRIGIPGSGGPDWLRNDWEPIICVTRPGRLPWSDNTACGHVPKWAPGGEMSHRLSNGQKRNQWGGGQKSTGGERKKDGKLRVAKPRPSHRLYTKRGPDGEMKKQGYVVPAFANPGNKIEAVYTATEVARMLEGKHDVFSCNVGAGKMGHDLAHENEAPFPLKLPEFLIQSFCPPGGKVCDPFTGSGTVCEAAVTHGRRFVGCDLRQSQVDLCGRRMATVTASLFASVV